MVVHHMMPQQPNLREITYRPPMTQRTTKVGGANAEGTAALLEPLVPPLPAFVPAQMIGSAGKMRSNRCARVRRVKTCKLARRRRPCRRAADANEFKHLTDIPAPTFVARADGHYRECKALPLARE